MFKKGQKIYLDYAAATPINDSVFKKMAPYFKKFYANPSSIYMFAQKSRAAIDISRNVIAKILNCKPLEIFFTSGGTEANNWAIFGVTEAYRELGKHIIITSIEHDSVINPSKELERRGYDLTILPVNKDGQINLVDLKNEIRQETVLVSVMYGNNEIGTIQDVASIGRFLKLKKIPFHVDACQAPGMLSLNVQALSVDLMTINANKIYGPKGVGALYISENIKIMPLLFGGGQERRLRAGTENTACIIGLAEALKISEKIRNNETRRLIKLRDDFINLIKKQIPGINLNGDPVKRLPNNINISINDVDGESLLLRLDMEGVCVSSGSACTTGSLEPSHVLIGIGLNKKQAKSSIRFTLGRKTTWQELKKTAHILKKVVNDLRKVKF